MLFAENKQINGTARNALTGTVEQGWRLPSGEQRHCSPASQSRNWETFPVYGETSAAAVPSMAQGKREEGGMHHPAEQSGAMGRAGPRRKPAESLLAQAWVVSAPRLLSRWFASMMKFCYGKKDGDKVAGREKQHNHLAGSEMLQMPFYPKEKASAWTLCFSTSSKQHWAGKTSRSARVCIAVLDNSSSFTISGFNSLCVACSLYCVKPI